jgi:predicted transposase/invertase (TIGR01784 family)
MNESVRKSDDMIDWKYVCDIMVRDSRNRYGNTYYMEKEYEQLISEGMEDGRKQGVQEGLKIGRQEKEEFRTMTARSLYEMEMPIDKISKVTKFSVEELKEILEINE